MIERRPPPRPQPRAPEGGEAVLRAILDAIPAAICLVEAPSWRVGFVNAAMRRLLGEAIQVGMTYVELTGLFDQITPGGAPARFEDRPLYRTLVQGEPVAGVEVFVDLAGERVPLLMSTTPIRDERGEATVAAVVTLEDLRPLRVVDRAKEEFLMLVSHELRTPLTLILGQATALLMEDVEWAPEQRRAFLEDIRRQAERLSAMVGELLDLTAISAGRFRVEPEWVALAPLLRAVVRAHIPRLAGRPVTVRVPRRLPPVLADPRRIEQVMANLLENVARHTPAGTAVEVAAAVRDGRLLVTVADDGPGIPTELLDAVFEPFRQGPGRRGGAGLGLAVARAIVREHGGTIAARPRDGGGTVVEVSLPLPPPESAPPPRPRRVRAGGAPR